MLHLLAPALLLAASAAIGLYMGWQYLRRIRSRPVLIGVHLILGMAGLEAMVMLLRGTPDGTVLPAGTVGKAAAALLFGTVLAGLATPMVARRYPRRIGSLALAAHVGLGVAGFAFVIGWMVVQ